MQEKPSFFKSVGSGIIGYVKGMLAGGTVGAITGALVGAVLGGLATGGAGIFAGGAIGAGYGASIMATVGAFSGMVTGVVESRERGASPQEVAKLAKLSFAQGVQVGHEVALSKEQGTHFQDMIASRTQHAGIEGP